jgi:hypothetical protein
MIFTPGEYAIAASLKFAGATDALKIQGIEFMEPVNPAERRVTFERGFFKITLRDCRGGTKGM